MIGYENYFTNNLCRQHHKFSELRFSLNCLIYTTCDVTNVNTNDSLDRIGSRQWFQYNELNKLFFTVLSEKSRIFISVFQYNELIK